MVFGFAVALTAILFFFVLFATSTAELKKNSDDFYKHPFTVNDAASSLKISLYQMRDEALVLVLLRYRDDEWNDATRQITGFERDAERNLAVIKANFLGDMSRVSLLEKHMGEWHLIRESILNDVRQGHFEAADRKVKDIGTPKYNDILREVDYVLGYSRHRANQFVLDADNRSETVLYQGEMLTMVLFFVVLITASTVVCRVRYLHGELTRQATLDFLTGIHNRRSFLEQVQDEAYRSTRYGHHFSLAVVDLDHFKKVNDIYGHHAGDVALKHFCTTCLAGLRQSDVLGRLGGEEFGILMPNTPSVEAQQVVERIRQALAESIVREGTADIRITGSFGLVSSEVISVAQSLDALFKAADVALYSAKEHGRNQVVVTAGVA